MTAAQVSDYVNLASGQGPCVLCGRHVGDMKAQGGRALRPFHVRGAGGSLHLVHTSDRVCLGHRIIPLDDETYKRVQKQEKAARMRGGRVTYVRPVNPPPPKGPGLTRRNLEERLGQDGEEDDPLVPAVPLDSGDDGEGGAEAELPEPEELE